MTIFVTTRVSDPETHEFLFCKDFELEVPSNFDVNNPDYQLIFDGLLEGYPDLLPTEYPGVDMEITHIE